MANLPEELSRLAFWRYYAPRVTPAPLKQPCRCSTHDHTSAAFALAIDRLAGRTGEAWGEHHWVLTAYLEAVYAAVRALAKDGPTEALYMSPDKLLMPTRLGCKYNNARLFLALRRSTRPDDDGWVFADWMDTDEAFDFVGHDTWEPPALPDILGLCDSRAFSAGIMIHYPEDTLSAFTNEARDLVCTKARRAMDEAFLRSVKLARNGETPFVFGWKADRRSPNGGRSVIMLPLVGGKGVFSDTLYMVLVRSDLSDETDCYRLASIISPQLAYVYARVVSASVTGVPPPAPNTLVMAIRHARTAAI
jgi:hypothetical protein